MNTSPTPPTEAEVTQAAANPLDQSGRARNLRFARGVIRGNDSTPLSGSQAMHLVATTIFEYEATIQALTAELEANMAAIKAAWRALFDARAGIRADGSKTPLCESIQKLAKQRDTATAELETLRADTADTAWLIEMDGLYWNGQGDSVDVAFTPDHDSAVRFARANDANRAGHWLELTLMARYPGDSYPVVSATEHKWVSRSTRPEGGVNNA